MAFYDDLARDPKSEEEFWTIIEETFVQVKGALTSYDVETREEALTGARRIHNEGDTFRSSPGDFIRHRGVREEYDSRDYFLELGKRFLTDVEKQIKARKLTPKFAKDWGVVMMCHGFISAHILDDSDGYSHVRAGLLSVESRSTNAQKKWVARQILGVMQPGRRRLTRKQADAWLAGEIGQLIEKGNFPPHFERGWFETIMDNGALRDAYCQKRLTKAQLLELANQPADDVPPINFSR
jgi:hypothetical protein